MPQKSCACVFYPLIILVRFGRSCRVTQLIWMSLQCWGIYWGKAILEILLEQTRLYSSAHFRARFRVVIHILFPYPCHSESENEGG